MDTVIRTVKLTKKFKDVLAVSEISLNVSKGEIYGFLGLNGAGKTTTIRMLLGMISPDNGEAFIHEQRVHAGNTELWKKIGYLVEMPFSYPNLTVRENLEIIRKLRFIKDKNAVASVMEKLRLTGICRPEGPESIPGQCTAAGCCQSPDPQPRDPDPR